MAPGNVEGGRGFSEGLAAVLATLFSPAKLALLAYAFIVYRGHPVTPHLKWYILGFVLVDVVHVDVLRRALHGLSDGWAERLKGWSGVGKK